MSAQANIVINDGAATPVAHTFAPKGARSKVDGKDVAVWRDQSPAYAAGYLSLTEQHTPVNTNGMEKFRYVIDVPTLEAPAGGGSFVPPPTKAFSTVATIEVWVNTRASAAEIANIVAYVKNFTANAYFAAAINNREAAW